MHHCLELLSELSTVQNKTLLDSGNSCVIELLKYDWCYCCAGNSDRKEKKHVVPFPYLFSTVGR